MNLDFLTINHLNRNKNSIAVSIENITRKISLLNLPKKSYLQEFQMSLMRNLLKVVCCISILTVFTAAQASEIDKAPQEIQKLADDHISGKDSGYFTPTNFEEEKMLMGFDSSTKLSDLKTGEPAPIYYIKKDSISKLDENASISAIMQKERVWAWMFPVLAKGKCIATLEIGKTQKHPEWHVVKIRKTGNKEKLDEWEYIRESWPQSAGYHPIIICLTEAYKYFHIPEIDDYNLTPIYRLRPDSLSRSTDSSYKKLVPSKNAFKFVKARFGIPSEGGGK